MKAASALKRAGRAFAVTLLLLMSVACGNGNDNDNVNEPTPAPMATAPGDYFVTRFLVTNTNDPQNIVDGASFGLSIYFTLNENGTLSGAGQTPSDPAAPSPITGNWELDSEGSLTVTFTDDQGNVRVITGTLSFDADGNVVFQGSQTAGEPLEIGNDNQLYNISTFEMRKYGANIAVADLLGEWVAVSGTAFKNQDPSVKEDALADGAGLTLIFEEDGNVEVRNTFAGGGQDNFLAPFTLVDNFHFTLQVEEDTVNVVFSLIDEVLKIYIYDVERSFEGDSVSSPATLVYTLERP